MILNHLKLSNFRNYIKSEFSLSPKTNLIVGPNAVGKTNILEAICFLASGRSFRVKGVEREAIRYGEEMARIQAVIVQLSNDQIINYQGAKKKQEEKRLEIVLTVGEVAGQKTGKKKYLLNDVSKRAIDFLGNLRAVYFGPEDLDLVTDSPSRRRKYLDMVLYQVDREYSRAHLSYEKGLKSRNKILELIKEGKDLPGFSEENVRKRLYFWDQLLIKNGNIITREREDFIDFVNNFDVSEFGLLPVGFSPAKPGQKAISGFQLEYDRSTISIERLAKYAQEEVAAGVTLVGPHRDDFAFRGKGQEGGRAGKEEKENNLGHDLSVYGSRGEQRMAVFWLKLGELAFIKSQVEDLPVLLLDDIFSELDIPRRKLVFDLIGSHQTVITTADRGMLKEGWLKDVNLIEL